MKRFFRKLRFCLRIMKSRDSGWIVVNLNKQQQFDVLLNSKNSEILANYISVDRRVVEKLLVKLNAEPIPIQAPSLN